MKKFLNKIMLRLGYVTVEESKSDIEKAKSDVIKEMITNEPKPEREFRSDEESFIEYWDECLENKYIVWYFKNHTLNENQFVSFLYEFAKFDWEEIRAYMEKKEWFWHDRKKSPTIKQLQGCVIALAYKGGATSGGFNVSFDADECKISFNKTR